MTRRPDNGLLRVLDDQAFELIAPFLEQADAAAGDVLCYAGDHVEATHFPCGPTMASLVVSVEDGLEVDTLLIGREGAVGGILNNGLVPAYSRMVIKLKGPLVRLPIRKFEKAQARSSSLREVFARYRDCLLGQALQSTACNAAHTVEQRAAKWMIATLERAGGDRIELTQEQLAGFLGVGRSYTSRLMQSFKAKGILINQRGTIVVRNAAALQRKSCDCNNAVRKHFEETLPGVYPVLQD